VRRPGDHKGRPYSGTTTPALRKGEGACPNPAPRVHTVQV
jgi:hypothetical protein